MGVYGVVGKLFERVRVDRLPRSALRNPYFDLDFVLCLTFIDKRRLTFEWLQ